jgi:hypothetical protein
MRTKTVKELMDILSKLNPEDVVVIETTDDNGDAEDLYPMYVDVIEISEGYNEVRLCQMSQDNFDKY